jgi:Cu+-exporting ATPase
MSGVRFRVVFRACIFGLLAVALQLSIYFGLVSLVSGWSFALDQFYTYWYYILGLALGFGTQIGLFTYLRSAIRLKQSASGGVLAAAGATSTLAMVSCCTHYLANIVPVIGISGLASFVGQYQTKIFWVGLAFNLAGIIFISSRIVKFHREGAGDV